MNDPLTDEHKLYHPADAESGECHHWDGHILMDLQIAIQNCDDIDRQYSCVCSSLAVKLPRRGGMIHCTDGHKNRTSKKTMVPSVRLLYRNGVIQFQQVHSRIHSFSVVKNDYGCKLMSNSFPGHHDQPYRKYVERRRKLRRKHGPSTFRNIFIVSRHLCKTLGIKTLFLSTMSIPNWVQAGTSAICGRAQNVLTPY
jgi:hypothetical protein